MTGWGAVGRLTDSLGAPAEPPPVHVFSLIMGLRSFAGSAIGGIRETQDMLDFCAENGLGAEIEVIPADKINDAHERVLASDVRYRFVIDTSTLQVLSNGRQTAGGQPSPGRSAKPAYHPRGHTETIAALASTPAAMGGLWFAGGIDLRAL